MTFLLSNKLSGHLFLKRLSKSIKYSSLKRHIYKILFFKDVWNKHCRKQKPILWQSGIFKSICWVWLWLWTFRLWLHNTKRKADWFLSRLFQQKKQQIQMIWLCWIKMSKISKIKITIITFFSLLFNQINVQHESNVYIFFCQLFYGYFNSLCAKQIGNLFVHLFNQY